MKQLIPFLIPTSIAIVFWAVAIFDELLVYKKPESKLSRLINRKYK